MGREESKLKHMTMEGDHRETHYNVELTLDPEQGSLHANVELLCSPIEQQCSNLEFYLHKSMEIKSITGSVPITYQFDVEQPCSFPFTPDAGTLKIKLTQPVEDDKLLRIWFEYEGNIGSPMGSKSDNPRLGGTRFLCYLVPV